MTPRILALVAALAVLPLSGAQAAGRVQVALVLSDAAAAPYAEAVRFGHHRHGFRGRGFRFHF